jgi:hypothetical protein
VTFVLCAGEAHLAATVRKVRSHKKESCVERGSGQRQYGLGIFGRAFNECRIDLSAQKTEGTDQHSAMSAILACKKQLHYLVDGGRHH